MPARATFRPPTIGAELRPVSGRRASVIFPSAAASIVRAMTAALWQTFWHARIERRFACGFVSAFG